VEASPAASNGRPTRLLSASTPDAGLVVFLLLIVFFLRHTALAGAEAVPRFSGDRISSVPGSTRSGKHPSGAADEWLAGAYEFPAGVQGNIGETNEFAGVHAKVLAGRLIIYCPAALAKDSVVAVVISFDEPGHWPARDWRSHRMKRQHTEWEFVVPVQDLDLPLLYFLRIEAPDRSVSFSPIRICRPREAGLEQPTRFFWAFLEGFEEGLESWAALDEETAPVRTGPIARHGRAALARTIPHGKGSVSVGTTRLRGSQVVQNGATGLRLWMRTREGSGRARFTLYSNAFTAKKIVAPSSVEAVLNEAWQQIDLPFSSFPALALGQIDYFAIEMIGESGTEFLLDDLELLGGW
jgi:hypothetical protein